MDILNILSKEYFVSGSLIAKRLKISRAAVHKQISALKSRGYGIISSKGTGYKLESDSTLLLESVLKQKLSNKNFSSLNYSFKHFNEVSSTQSFAKQHALALSDGTVIIAETQSASYGRMGREWKSDLGGLWFSIILKPRLRPDEALSISLLTSLTLQSTLNAVYNMATSVKWPNDITFAGKKLAGIILEMAASQDLVNWLCVGVGINANNEAPAQFNATSLKGIFKKDIDRSELLSNFLVNFANNYKKFKAEGFKPFQKNYNMSLGALNKQISVDTGGEIITGTVCGADENGHLVLNTGSKNVKIISGTVISAV